MFDLKNSESTGLNEGECTLDECLLLALQRPEMDTE